MTEQASTPAAPAVADVSTSGAAPAVAPSSPAPATPVAPAAPAVPAAPAAPATPAPAAAPAAPTAPVAPDLDELHRKNAENQGLRNQLKETRDFANRAALMAAAAEAGWTIPSDAYAVAVAEGGIVIDEKTGLITNAPAVVEAISKNRSSYLKAGTPAPTDAGLAGGATTKTITSTADLAGLTGQAYIEARNKLIAQGG